VQILDTELYEFTHPCASIEQHFQHEPVSAAMGIGGLDEPFDLSGIEPVHASAALSRRLEVQLASSSFHDMLGLIVCQVMPAP